MSFQWRREGSDWRYDEAWTVRQQAGRWYVLKDGRFLLTDYPNAQAAMEAAERLIGK